MVKIPELPGNYRTGDVVNGHVLTPRGHWVPLAEAASRGAQPRRYLDTQVSTLRDSDAPTQVSRERPRAPQTTYSAQPQAAWVPGTTTTAAPTPSPQAAAREAAARDAATRPAAGPRTTTPMRPTAAPSTTARQGQGATPPPPASGYSSPVAPPPPAAAYRQGPGGPTGAPAPGGPYAPPPPRAGQNLPRVGANPSTAGPTIRPSGPTSGGSASNVPPPTIRQRKRGGGVIGFAVVAFILFQIISAFARNVPDFFDTDPVVEWETSAPAEVVPEFEVFVENWEVWATDFSPGYLVDLRADDRGDELIGVSLEIEALDADGAVLATASDWVQINGDEPVRAIGTLDEGIDASEIDDLNVVIDAFTLVASDAAVVVTDWELAEDDGGPPVVLVTVDSVGSEALSYARVWVVLRDETGAAVAGGSGYESELEPGEVREVGVVLWDLAELPEDFTIEAGATGE